MGCRIVRPAEGTPGWPGGGVSSHRVEVPLRTSHIRHLKASALFLKVHTLQSQYPSSDDGFGCRFGLKKREV